MAFGGEFLEKRVAVENRESAEQFALCTLALALEGKKRELAAAEAEIQSLRDQTAALEQLNKSQQSKCEQYDNMRRELKNLHIAAEFEAFRLVDSAKVEAMESICITDEIHTELGELLLQLVSLLQSNVEISPFVDARAMLLANSLENTLTKLETLKKQFYLENHIPMDLSMKIPKYHRKPGHDRKPDARAASFTAPIELFSPFPQLENERLEFVL